MGGEKEEWGGWMGAGWLGGRVRRGRGQGGWRRREVGVVADHKGKGHGIGGGNVVVSQ